MIDDTTTTERLATIHRAAGLADADRVRIERWLTWMLKEPTALIEMCRVYNDQWSLAATPPPPAAAPGSDELDAFCAWMDDEYEGHPYAIFGEDGLFVAMAEAVAAFRASRAEGAE